jgi:hypothetical protein
MNFCGAPMFIDSFFLGSPTRWSVRLRKCKRRSLFKGKADEAVAEVKGQEMRKGMRLWGIYAGCSSAYTPRTPRPLRFLTRSAASQ